MARRIEVEIVGDSSSLERSFKRSAQAASKFNRDISKATRGAAAGSGIFQGFGRSVAFASGGFLAFQSASAFLRTSIDAAREAEVAQKSLAAQMRASGDSFSKNRRQIERVSVSYGKFGFQNDEIVAGLTVLERGTGQINKSFGLLGLTADLARAKQLDFAKAANVVAKVFGGQETALRRAVPGLAKNAHGLDLIRLASQKLAGQAAANTTESERFAATLHNTEEIIGTALLPVLNQYLAQLGDWLTKMNESGQLQRNVNTIASDSVTIFGALASTVGAAAEAVGKYNEAVGKLPGGKGGALQRTFGGNAVQQLVGALDIWERAKESARRIRTDLGLSVDVSPGVDPGRSVLENIRRFGQPMTAAQIQAEIAKTAPPGPSAAALEAARLRPLRGRFNVQELKLAQARLTATLADDRRILTVEKGILEQQIAQAKTLKDKTTLTERLAGVVAQIHGFEQGTADALKRQNELLKDRADAIKSAVLDRLQRQQTGRENQRALRDAKEQLRLARLIGGPAGIRGAARDVQDAQFRIFMAQVEAAKPRLGRGPGGQTFALGQVITINVHGADSPEKVAAQVAAILKRRARHTSTQSRGPAAGVG